jgi:hypothetical protein
VRIRACWDVRRLELAAVGAPARVVARIAAVAIAAALVWWWFGDHHRSRLFSLAKDRYLCEGPSTPRITATPRHRQLRRRRWPPSPAAQSLLAASQSDDCAHCRRNRADDSCDRL